jgi:hypothetical protein
MVGLCTAYTHGNKTEQGKALESPAFTALIKAAGGKVKVATFCVVVLKDKGGQSPSPKPSTHPTGKPSTHPSGGPSTHPSPKPSDAGKPSSHPTSSPKPRSTD